MQQYDALYAYCHDKPPSRPSQIKMLFEGGNTYRDLYKRQQRVATAKKDNKDSTTEFVLKKSCIVIPPGDFAQRRRSTHSISRKKLHPAHFSLLVEHSWWCQKEVTNSKNGRWVMLSKNGMWRSVSRRNPEGSLMTYCFTYARECMTMCFIVLLILFFFECSFDANIS